MTFAGIIAAGHGERLAGAHPRTVKPLVPVRGKPLVHWVVSGLRSAGTRSLVVLLNTDGDAVREYLEAEFRDLEWTFLRRDTGSSWESFRLVSRTLSERAEEFLVSTVDALIPPAETARFSREAFSPPRPAAALALTRFVEDEKPLWADVDESGAVTALGPKAVERRAVTCGLYALSRPAVSGMKEASAFGRLRDFWIDLVGSGRPVRGLVLADTVDVDRPDDLPAAEKVVSCFDV